MSVTFAEMHEILKRVLPPLYEESERTGVPFSMGGYAGVSTYHPTTCKCGCLEPRRP